MAHTYGHLYGFKTTGLRFFTVYGPWGRPDMAYYLFAEAISKNTPIKVFNNGEMERDFTYIDDIVNGIAKVIEANIVDREHYKIYNKIMEQLYLKKCNCGNFQLEHYFNTKTNEIIYINKNSDKLEKFAKAIDVIIF